MNSASDNKTIKPITVVRAEFMSSLADLINNSSLPFFVIDSILKDIEVEVRAAAQKQYENDKENYEKELSKNNEAEEK